MPNVRTLPDFLARLKSELIGKLKISGIEATVGFQPIPMTKLFRVWVLAPKFKHMRPSERQDLVWRIADSVLSRDEQMRISMILTLTEVEAEGSGPKSLRPAKYQTFKQNDAKGVGRARYTTLKGNDA